VDPFFAALGASDSIAKSLEQMTNADDIPATLDTKRLNERIHFRASRTTITALHELKNKYGISMSDSIRKGIAIYLMAKRFEASGQHLCFVNPETGNSIPVQTVI
jgi:hypothetical protein